MTDPDTFLDALELGDLALEQAAISAIDDALGPLPRQDLPDGTVLLREGEQADAVWLVHEGRISLTRDAEHGPVLLHQASTGPIVGLHTLAGSPTAFMTCTAAGPVTVSRLEVDALEAALRNHPSLLAYFVALLLRTHTGRHRRSVELQLEVARLNRSLAAERDQLADALARLEATQARLVEAARMATLGELAAGLAHELNNPVGAIERAARFVAEDVQALVAELPGSGAMHRAIEDALTSSPVPTAEHRRRRRALRAALGDPGLADRMLAAGVTDVDQARSLLAGSAAGPGDLLARLERHHQLGIALRNLVSASERIASLVASLRSYARPSGGPMVDVDVHDTVEDALRLLGHRLGQIDLVRRYAALPSVRARPGELAQLWTNVIANALDALGDHGQLVVETGREERGGGGLRSGAQVVVRISDDGPGIPPDAVEKLFEERFTTKRGRVAYGLGMGLVISKRIVEAHGGTIVVRPGDGGGTTVEVRLPVRSPPPGDERKMEDPT